MRTFKTKVLKTLCVNANYIDMLHEAFKKMSQCFDYNLDKQERLLQLINQESGGILNIQSRTGANCMGQITEPYILDINRLIESREKSKPLEFSDIYDQIEKKCPDLKTKLLEVNSSLTCKTIKDPYSCLFYTFFGFELSLQRIKKNLRLKSQSIGKEWILSSKLQTEEETLPIRLNEMMNISVFFTDGTSQTYTAWDNSEFYDILKSLREKEKEFNFTTRKVPLFESPEDIEYMFSFWSHNGGLTMSGRRVIAMIENLKQSLTQSCKNKVFSENYRCRLRAKIQSGNSLSNKEVLGFFQKDILKHYPIKKNRAQVCLLYTKYAQFKSYDL